MTCSRHSVNVYRMELSDPRALFCRLPLCVCKQRSLTEHSGKNGGQAGPRAGAIALPQVRMSHSRT